MVKLYDKEFRREKLLKRVGDISQIGGLKPYELTEGNQKGVSAVDVRTGSCFNFTILPGRGMDISYAEYQGIPLCWRSSTGEVSPSHYESEGLGWLRSFYGGLLTTCGLTYFGAPCVDKGVKLGLHGRISNIPAQRVSYNEYWEGDEYFIEVKGTLRETAIFGENLLLTRKISTRLGETRLWIDDTVENLGYESIEHMILYHIDIGFPIVDKGTKLIAPSKNIIPREEELKKYPEPPTEFSAPIPNFKECVYYRKMKADTNKKVTAILLNDAFNNGQGMGIYIKYNLYELPEFIEWKMTGEGIYVVGLEPANARVEGRAKERAEGRLVYLAPGERREYHLEIGVIRSKDELPKLTL